jgi:putative oxidoreductase
MRSIFGRLQEPAYFLMRLVTGFTFMCHGLQKVFGLLGGDVQKTMSLLWVGGVIELVCGALIAIGLLTRPAAFLASGEMAYAYFVIHMGLDASHEHWIPILNKGELAAVYCVLFFYICGRGGGPVSVDRAVGLER